MGYMLVVVCFFRFVSFCSRLLCVSYAPTALHRLLYGSGSSLCRGLVRYVVSLSIHGVISPISTYRKCMRDNWSACR